MTTDAISPRHVPAEPHPDSRWSALAQGVRRMLSVTAKSVVDGTRAMWPTLVVLGGLLLVGQLAISYGRSLERQDSVVARQAETKERQDATAKELAEIKGMLTSIQSSLSGVPSLEARVIAMEKDLAEQEREGTLFKDEVRGRISHLPYRTPGDRASANRP